MSRRRARHTDDDGIELMLDTIANLFGGILLIAMLIAIMAGQQTHAIAERGGRDDVYGVIRTEDAIAVAMQKIRSVDLEHARSLAAIASAATDAESLALLEQLLQDQIESRDSNRAKLEQRRQILETLRSQASERESIVGTLERELEQLRITLEERARQLQAAEEMRSPPLVLPIEGRTEKSALNIVLRYGRLSVPFGPRLERIEPHAKYRDFDGGIEFDVAPEGGVRVEPGFESTPLWRQVIGRHHPASWHLRIAVYPDSYDAFLKLRPVIIGAGYGGEIAIEPHPAGEPILYWFHDGGSLPVGN